MKKILFVYPNINRQKSVQIGIASLITVAKSCGYECDLFDITFIGEKDINYSFINKINDYQPDIIGISSRSNEWETVKTLIDLIPEKVFIIVGGPHPTVAPDEVIEYDKVDCIVIGEGEKVLKNILLSYKEGKIKSDILGTYIKLKNIIEKNQPEKLNDDLSDIDYPDWSLFDERHIIHSTFGKIYRIGSFEGSRGCPYGCAYCINKYLQNYYSGKGKYHRKKSVDRLINEILYFKEKYKIEFVYLADETFLLDNNWLKEFSEKYKNKVDLPFSFMTRAETATEEKMELAAAAGAKYVSIGIESGSEEFRRKYLNRKMTNEQIINAFRSAKKYGIETNSFNMIGFPYETEEDIFKTIKLNKIIQPDNIQCTIFYPFKGTELYKLCLENNFINENNLSAKNYYSSSILNFPNKKKTKIIRTRNLFEYLCSNKSLITKLLELSLNYKIIYNIFYGCIKIKKQNQYFYNLYKNIGFYKFIRHIIKKLCAY